MANDVLLISGDSRLAFKPVEYECPKCGHSTCDDVITVKGLEPYDGLYCQKCWVKWTSENCGKLQEKGNKNVD